MCLEQETLSSSVFWKLKEQGRECCKRSLVSCWLISIPKHGSINCCLVLNHFKIFLYFQPFLNFTKISPHYLKTLSTDWCLRWGETKKYSSQGFLLKHFPMTFSGPLSLLKVVIFVSILYTKYLTISCSLFLLICTMESAIGLYSVYLIPKLLCKLLNVKTCCFYFLASVFP